MDGSILLKIAGAVIGFLIAQTIWSLIFKAGSAARRAIPEGKGAEIAHRALMWVFGFGFIAVVVVSCVGGLLNDSPTEYGEPAYRGRR